MRTVITTCALAAAIALTTTTTMAPTLNSPVISQMGQAVLDGFILGSSAWPPVDARGRLQLVSGTCEEGRCKRASGGIDDYQ